ncbi:branched-chain amino acid ABC transporter permease [Hydrogenophaga sp. Root209]|uniref:branched-chain amino acid ABC transporter permease n=1 Tax=unclassified Hydrogenophaga TaxID=2610897 RepID=UPI0006FA36B4|nr:branched-chain amino acid ABC transporter permease [Hydrogenophaga sp. Root209]KRC01129.1 branched-chain amino acid ABC transporter permease [Hydrogenophaga sp. Root209]
MDPSGIFFTSHAGDRSLVRTRAQWVCLLALLLVLATLPWWASERWVSIGYATFITAVAVIGLQICTGYAGQINLGQSAFMGVGAYGAALAMAAGWNAVAALLIGGAGAALFGVMFGLTAARIKGFYLALTTIAAQALFHFLVLNLPSSWLGGAGGLHVESVSVFGISLHNDRAIYWFSLLVLVVMTIGAFGIVRSRHGRSFEAVRDDDVAAGMMGIPVAATKARAFLVSAFYAGVAGGLWVVALRHVSVEQFTLFNAIWMIAMMIVGGLGSIVGALIGTVMIQLAREGVTSLGPSFIQWVPAVGQDFVFAAMNVLLGTVIILFLLFEPKGVMHRIEISKKTYRLWPFPY